MATKKPAPKKGSGTKYALYGLGAVAVAYVGYKLYEDYKANAATMLNPPFSLRAA